MQLDAVREQTTLFYNYVKRIYIAPCANDNDSRSLRDKRICTFAWNTRVRMVSFSSVKLGLTLLRYRIYHGR